MLGFWNIDNTQNHNDALLVNALLSIGRYHIWKIRNCIKYGEENISPFQSTKRLKADLESHLQILVLSKDTSYEIKEKVSSIMDVIRRVF